MKSVTIALDDDARLMRPSRPAVEDPDNCVLVSQVSQWEAAIRQRMGKLHIGPGEIFPRLPQFGFDPLQPASAHLP